MTDPWYSVRATDPAVYHNETRCTEGNNIEDKYRRAGTDGRPLCKNCARIEPAEHRQGKHPQNVPRWV